MILGIMDSLISLSSILLYFTNNHNLFKRGENSFKSKNVKEVAFDGNLKIIRGKVNASMKQRTYAVENQQDEQNDVSELTAKGITYMKEFIYKKCRKGLLERGLANGVMIGVFKQLDNEAVKEFAGVLDNVDESLNRYTKRKNECMEKEREFLIKTMHHLDKTIGSLRLQAKAMMDGISYKNWSQIMDDAYKDFLSLFSSCNEDFFNQAKKEHQGMVLFLKTLNRNTTKVLVDLSRNKKAEKEKLFGSDLDFIHDDGTQQLTQKQQLTKQLLDTLPEGYDQVEFLKGLVDVATEWRKKVMLDDAEENEKREKNDHNETVAGKRLRVDDDQEVVAKKLRD